MLFTPIKPMLLQMGKEIIDDEWIYDVKWDGWRILIHKEGERIEAFTRHGNNVTAKFPELQNVGRSIKEHTAIIDTEGIVLRNGNSVFEDITYIGQLTNLKKIEQAVKTHLATFIAFDVLATNKLHIKEPLIERKKRLSSIIEPSDSLLVTPSIEGNGSHIFQLTKEKNLEGIVGKTKDSIYQINHRSNDWLKYKHFKIYNDAVILGYKENPFAMLVGTQLQNGNYKTLANVEYGFKPEEKAAFRKIASQIITNKDRNMIWLEPRLYCNVQCLKKTSLGLLRTVSFKGFSFDKTPEEWN